MAMKFDRILITYYLTFNTPFHCGTGLRSALIDRTVVRDHNDYLYVPGSTIKGVVREHCERLERMYSERDNIGDLIGSPHDARNALMALGKPVTMVSRIFGSHYNPGNLFFEDARLSDDDKKLFLGNNGDDRYKNLQTDLYTQVRLHRPTRTSVTGALYTSEFGVRDTKLEGKVSGWLRCTPIEEVSPQGPTYSLLLLLVGLHMLDRIGGNKSTGKGKCRCEVDTVKIGEQSYTKEDWQFWFDHLDALAQYPTQYEEDEEE
jgi:CRISPR/Cas system CSM-associated protein Csm3 (group 7 of RAMP superfamily)